MVSEDLSTLRGMSLSGDTPDSMIMMSNHKQHKSEDEVVEEQCKLNMSE